VADRIDEIGSALTTLTFEQERSEFLRQAGRRDPLPGAPLTWQVGKDAGDVVMLEPGKWQDYADPKSGLPPGCPVTPIYKRGVLFGFIDTSGQISEFKSGSAGKSVLEGVFAGRENWMKWACPRNSEPKRDRAGHVVRPSQVTGFDADWLRELLMAACAKLEGGELEIRGRGAHRGAAGELIYHAGNCILIGSEWHPSGLVLDGCAYPDRPAIGRPSLRRQPEGIGSPGDQLLEMLQSFNWDRADLDARLTLGWVMMAKIGGAVRRRPLLFVHGGEGSGKSTLHELLRLVMDRALMATSDTTPAGIYQFLGQDSIAVLVDELEADDGQRRRKSDILALMRIGYSGDQMHRGGKEGVGQNFLARSAFMASAVNKPATEAQDDSRMALVMLRERDKVGERLEINPKWAQACGRELLKRVMDWWARWDELEDTCRQALVDAGHNDRSADTFAPLMAGCHTALRDDMPELGELEDWKRWLDPRKLNELNTRESTWWRCFTQMLNAKPKAEVFRQRKETSVGALLLKFKETPAFLLDCRERLPQVGMQVVFHQGDPQDFEHALLFVASNHAGVRELFEGTNWSGLAGAPGPWAYALRQAPAGLWEAQAKCKVGFLSATAGIRLRIADMLAHGDVGVDDEED
jgi:hypothetical protein